MSTTRSLFCNWFYGVPNYSCSQLLRPKLIDYGPHSDIMNKFADDVIINSSIFDKNNMKFPGRYCKRLKNGKCDEKATVPRGYLKSYEDLLNEGYFDKFIN